MHKGCIKILYKSRRKIHFFQYYVICIFTLLYISGLYQYFLTQSFTSYYEHPGDKTEFPILLKQYKEGKSFQVKPINAFPYQYVHYPAQKCSQSNSIKILFAVKSCVNNFGLRQAIRQTWGKENRFADVQIRTLFLLGIKPEFQEKVNVEAKYNHDILQGHFEDTYYNTTLKTMMGLEWANLHCKNVEYFVSADDDFYISAKNLLRFVRNPKQYPNYLQSYVTLDNSSSTNDLYAGFVLASASPIRWYLSKYYVSLSEYPYSHWPPYVTGGAFVLSKASLVKMYVASLFTFKFGLDDVFMGMVAKKANITPLGSQQFHYFHLLYNPDSYKYVVAVHGFGDPLLLKKIWDEQRAYGNA